MMNRHGQLEHVDLVAFQDVFEDRAGLDHFRFDQLHVGHDMMIGLHDIGLALVFERQAEGQRDPFDR
jgi:hypothetical protein